MLPTFQCVENKPIRVTRAECSLMVLMDSFQYTFSNETNCWSVQAGTSFSDKTSTSRGQVRFVLNLAS